MLHILPKAQEFVVSCASYDRVHIGQEMAGLIVYKRNGYYSLWENAPHPGIKLDCVFPG